MLVDFSVENFMSFKDRQTISFEPDTRVKGLEKYYFISIHDLNAKRKPLQLLKIGMIYGANASGKSNLLKALDFFRQIVLKTKVEKNSPFSFAPFEMDYSRNSFFEVNFVSNQIKYNYKLEFNKDSIVYEELSEYTYLTSNRKKCIYKRTTDEKKQLPHIVFEKNIKIKPLILKQLNIVTLWNETVLAGFSKISVDIAPVKNVSDWFLNYLNILFPIQIPLDLFTTDLIEDKKISKSDIVRALQRADFNISDFSMKSKISVDDYLQGVMATYGDNFKFPIKVEVSEDLESSDLPQIIIRHKTQKKEFDLPYILESEGTKRYLGLMGVLMYLSKNKEFMMIDELDMSLHPELYEAFIISFLKNVNESQLLFTTQNREFLQKKHVLRKDALWISNKRGEGSTELYSFSDFGSSLIRNTTSIYNAYSMGKLGGRPNVASDLLFFVNK